MAGSIIGCSLQVWRNDSEAVSRILIRPRDKQPVYHYQCQAATPGINLSLTANKSISVHCQSPPSRLVVTQLDSLPLQIFLMFLYKLVLLSTNLT